MERKNYLSTTSFKIKEFFYELKGWFIMMRSAAFLAEQEGMHGGSSRVQRHQGYPSRKNNCFRMAHRYCLEWIRNRFSDPLIVDSDGHTEYRTDRDRKHLYVEIKGRPDRLASIIDELMVTEP